MIAAKKIIGTRNDGAPIIAVLHHTGRRKSFRRGGYTIRPAQETRESIMRALRQNQPGLVWIEDTDQPATREPGS